MKYFHCLNGRKFRYFWKKTVFANFLFLMFFVFKTSVIFANRNDNGIVGLRAEFYNSGFRSSAFDTAFFGKYFGAEFNFASINFAVRHDEGLKISSNFLAFPITILALTQADLPHHDKHIYHPIILYGVCAPILACHYIGNAKIHFFLPVNNSSKVKCSLYIGETTDYYIWNTRHPFYTETVAGLEYFIKSKSIIIAVEAKKPRVRSDLIENLDIRYGFNISTFFFGDLGQ